MSDYSVFPLSLPMPISGGKTEPFTASDILLKAASRIEEEGMWCQGAYFKGSVEDYEEAFYFMQPTRVRMAECAMGALISSTVELGADEDAHDEALDLLIETIGSNDVGPWNDTPGRTAHEVAAAMREAAL